MGTQNDYMDYINRASKFAFKKPYSQLSLKEKRLMHSFDISVDLDDLAAQGRFGKKLSSLFDRNERMLRSSANKMVERYKPLKQAVFVDKGEFDETTAPFTVSDAYHSLEDRPSLLYGGFDKDIYCDGFIAVLKQDTGVKDYLGKLVERKRKEFIRRKRKDGLSEKKAVEAWEEERGRDYKYPNTEQLIPKASQRGREMKIVALGFGSHRPTYLSDGERMMTVNSELLAFMREYLPKARMLGYKDSPSGPVTFVENGKVVGLMMPLYSDVPEVVVNYVQTGKKVPATKKTQVFREETEGQAMARLASMVRSKMGDPNWPGYGKYDKETERGEAGKAVYADILDGFRDRAEAVDYFKALQKGQVFFTAKGDEVSRKMLGQVLQRIRAYPPASPFRVGERTTKEQLQHIHETRSPHAQRMDEAKQAKTVVSPKKGQKWARRPARYDVRGIDTPKRRKPKSRKTARTSVTVGSTRR